MEQAEMPDDETTAGLKGEDAHPTDDGGKSARQLNSDRRHRGRKSGSQQGGKRVCKPRTRKLEEYSEAVEIYRTTMLPLREIASRTGVSFHGLAYHLYRWHRDLVLLRKGLPANAVAEYMDSSETKCCSRATEVKYAEAVESLRRGAASITQVAKKFGFNPATFRIYINEHEPELSKRYGQTRLTNGKTVLARSSKKYAEAIRLYKTTPESLRSIAGRLRLVYISLWAFMRRNCPEVIRQHERIGH